MVENTPDAGTDLFFLGSYVDESHTHSPLYVITGQFGVGLDTNVFKKYKSSSDTPYLFYRVVYVHDEPKYTFENRKKFIWPPRDNFL